MKTLDDHFTDWESHTFGYGYGSGEEHTLQALKRFMETVPLSGNYDYKALEKACGPTVAWLLINVFAHADLIEYGTSPRFAWLTDRGKALKAYIDSKTVDELGALTGRDDYIHCYPDYCNCDEPVPVERCHNPFWREHSSTNSL